MALEQGLSTATIAQVGPRASSSFSYQSTEERSTYTNGTASLPTADMTTHSNLVAYNTLAISSGMDLELNFHQHIGCQRRW